MKLSHVENSDTLQGGFNTNYLMQDDELGGLFLMREPRVSPNLIERLEHEFQSYNFWLDKGNSVRRRPPVEQVAVMTRATLANLKVIHVAFFENERIFVPFIDKAQTIDQHLPKVSDIDAEHLVGELYTDLYNAHTQHNIVYGDRWSKNILIAPDKAIETIHVDFDLQYEGPNAIDLEVGRMTFYLLHAGREKVIPMLIQSLSARGWHNLEFVEHIVRGHAEYFNGTDFGNMGDVIELLFRTLHKTLEKAAPDAPDAIEVLLQANGQTINSRLKQEVTTFRAVAQNILNR